MKKTALLIVTILSFLALSTLCFAQELKLTVDNKDITAYSGDTQEVEIDVFNNQDFADKFSITVFPQYWGGITVTLDNYILDVPANSDMKTKLYLNIPECAEEMTTTYTITAKSLKNDAITDSKSVSLNTIRKYQVCLSDLRLDKQVIYPGEGIKITTSITNPAANPSMQLFLRTNIVRNNEIIDSFDDKIETVLAKSTQKVERTYSFNRYVGYGFYTVEVILKDNLNKVISTKKIDVRIAATENVTVEKSSKWGLLGQTIILKVKNEGNDASTGIVVTETVPLFVKPFFFPKVEPVSEEVKENRVIYTWAIDKLEAGEEKNITYQIDLTNAWIVVLILIAATVYAFKYVFTLTLVKKQKYKRPVTKEKEITVLLEAKNRTRHVIKDLYVRDFVPSVATVVERFDTMRPVVRKIPGGTELTWKLDFLRPREERVITYRIKPVMDMAGLLKLPSANMRYENKKKEVKRVVSKNIFVKQV